MKVPLLDLRAQYAALREETEAAVRAVFESQHFILGPAVESFEQAVAAYCGVPHAIGVSSGTDAILACLMAEGVAPGDEVITSPYSFFATAGCVARLGARPVFVDIDPGTYNLRADRVAERITPRTRALLPVHLFGQPADMDALREMAAARGLTVIEDACQAIGAERNGARAGGLGDYGCFSFFPSKNLGGAGDGGMVVTRDPVRAARLRRLRNHGMEPKYIHPEIGGNFRLDALQAAVLAVKLPRLDGWTAARQRNAARYERLFLAAGLTDRLTLPDVSGRGGRDRHVVNQYVIRAPQRDALREHLSARGIGHEVYYPVPLHLQPCFAHWAHRPGDFPESERAAAETLALPIYAELTDAQAEAVVAAIADFYRSA